MPLRFEFPDARDWKYIIESLEAIIDEACFIANSEALRLRALDPSRIAMVDLYLPREAFSTYEVEGEVKLGINFDDLNKILRRAKTKDRVVLEAAGNRIRITISDAAERTFTIPLLDIAGEELPSPRVTFDVTARMLSDTLRDTLKDAEMISDTVRFEAEKQAFKIVARSDRGEMEAKFSLEQGSLIEYDVKNPSTSSYSLNYLNDIVGRAYRVSDVITIEFATNRPLSLTFDVAGGGTLRYYLAPRLEA